MIPNPYLSGQSPLLLPGSIEVSTVTCRKSDPKKDAEMIERLTVHWSPSSSWSKKKFDQSEKGTSTGHETKPIQLNRVDDEVYDVGRHANEIRDDENTWLVAIGEEDRGKRDLRGEKSGNGWDNDSKPKHTSYLNVSRKPRACGDHGQTMPTNGKGSEYRIFKSATPEIWKIQNGRWKFASVE